MNSPILSEVNVPTNFVQISSKFKPIRSMTLLKKQTSSKFRPNFVQYLARPFLRLL